MKEVATGHDMPYRVLLYYLYTPITDLESFREAQHLFCLETKLLGRIIVANEGLNGSVSGLTADCEAYMSWLSADPRFTGIQFKVEPCEQPSFTKLHVRVKEEIVNSDLGVNPTVQTGIHLSPAEFNGLRADPEVVLVDMRSRYEHAMGKFKGAVTLNMDNLRELPEHLSELEHLKSKKVITYCTGGIKCEKASAFLLKNGFENVYQLHGGIIQHGLETGGEDFEGVCYVFDNRLTTEVNRVNPSTASHCQVCGTPSVRMINCANPDCNDHLPICENCGEKLEGACSQACQQHPRKRKYDGTGHYPKQTRGYSTLLGYRSRSDTPCLLESERTPR